MKMQTMIMYYLFNNTTRSCRRVRTDIRHYKEYLYSQLPSLLTHIAMIVRKTLNELNTMTMNKDCMLFVTTTTMT